MIASSPRKGQLAHALGSIFPFSPDGLSSHSSRPAAPSACFLTFIYSSTSPGHRVFVSPAPTIQDTCFGFNNIIFSASATKTACVYYFQVDERPDQNRPERTRVNRVAPCDGIRIVGWLPMALSDGEARRLLHHLPKFRVPRPQGHPWLSLWLF